MSSSDLTLAHFLQPVPVCSEKANLEAVLAIFQSGQHEQLVVVNEGQSPRGVIRCCRLIPYLVSGDNGPEWSAIVNWIEPIPTLLAQMLVGEFCQTTQFNFNKDKSFALVDSEGKFLGLLDTYSLLQNTVGLTKPKIAMSCNDTFCQSLSHLLEPLPLPVMLQTGEGQIISRNLSWCQRIGSLHQTNDDNAVKVAALKNSPCRQGEFQAYCSTENSLPLAESTPRGLQNPSKWELKEPKQNRDKREGVWQFIKLPLNFPSLTNPIWLILATDITEEKRLCKELAAKNAESVQLNRLKDEFLACISHELKSPLTAVMGLSSLLQEQKLGSLNSRQSKYAKQIYQSGRQLLTLVNDILDLTRLETGQLKLTPRPVTIKKACQGAYEEAKKGKTSVEEHQFSLEIDPDLEIIVADELRLGQMLVHLLDNALKFTASGGKIGLRVSRWFSWIAFTVWDTGIGIAEESQHLIFQKFQQLENPLTREFNGSGLGLVLTQRLARTHGGDVSFISQVGKGSQFTLLLPPSPRQIPPTRPRDPFILIIEAVPKYIENLTVHLVDLGYRVVIARTGTEAVEKARQLQPCLILLNPVLPLLSGWDVLTLLKSDSTTKSIPVILMTTGTAQRRSEGDGFLDLPVQKEALRSSLNHFQVQPSAPTRCLTILHLHPPGGFARNAEFAVTLSNYVSRFNHRVLEVDCLEQAEILARVWQPDVILLNGKGLIEPLTYLQSLSQLDGLASLPLVTLDASITEVANQVKNLAVFPCLVPVPPNLEDLLAVIQIAAGITIAESI